MVNKGPISSHKKLGLFIGVAAVALSVLPMLFIFIVTSQKANTELLNIVSEGVRAKALYISHGIEAIYARHEVTIKNLSQSDVLETQNITAIEQYLSEVIQDNPHFSSIEIADRSGRIIAESQARIYVGKNIKEQYPSLVDKFNKSLNGRQGDILFSDLLDLEKGSDKKGIIFITPVTDDANINVIYLLIVKTNMVAVHALIENLNQDDGYGNYHNIYIVTKLGGIVSTTDDHMRPSSSFSLATIHPEVFAKMTQQNKTGTIHYQRDDGNEMMAGYADIQLYKQAHSLDWSVIAEWNKNEITEPVVKLEQQIAIASLVVSLGVFLLMSLMGRRIINLVWSQSNYDSLTLLPNRQLLSDRLLQCLKTARRSNTSAALLFIDLDQFKEINDTLGHYIGDELLGLVAERISHCVREMDTVARIGGDEFAVVINEFTQLSKLEQIAQHILNAIEAPITIQHEVIYITASIGITLYPQDGKDTDTLLKNADQAMYLAKNEGRNQFRFFTQEMQQKALHRLNIATRLRVAISENQFELYYQPIVSLDDGVLRKVEALIRWNDPINGMISPLEFIQIAEETNQIIELGDWVFKEAAKQLDEWRNNQGFDIQISINASSIQFKAHDLYQKWAAIIESYHLPSNGIIVEITESLLMVDDNVTAKHLLNFRDAGIPVAIDDFGTGYSALSYLNRLDIDYLKIDKSFIDGIAESPGDFHLTEGIIAVAHKLGLEVIAEGVETPKQRQILREIHCDYCQGYLVSKPLPVKQLEEFIHFNHQAQEKKDSDANRYWTQV